MGNLKNLKGITKDAATAMFEAALQATLLGAGATARHNVVAALALLDHLHWLEHESSDMSPIGPGVVAGKSLLTQDVVRFIVEHKLSGTEKDIEKLLCKGCLAITSTEGTTEDQTCPDCGTVWECGDEYGWRLKRPEPSR